MDIKEIRSAASKGDASAQLELAHAYRDGIGVKKNNRYYLSDLTKAAAQNNTEAIKELVEYHSNRRNKNADIMIARDWVKRGKSIGIVFPEDDLLKIGDTEKCTEKIEEYLFGKTVRFSKAKELILKGNIPSDTLYSWAGKYHLEHKDDKKRIGEIVYLYLISSKGDAEKINEAALTLLDKSKKDNIKIAISLFKEGYRRGNQYAAASYMHCLLVGKGVSKNVKSAAKIYFEFKGKGVILSRAFSSPTREGMVINIPKSIAWKRELVSLKIEKFATSLTNTLLAPFGSFFSLPNEYWKYKAEIATQREKDAIDAEVASGNLEAADGCRDGGCTENYLSSLRVFFGYLSILGILLAVAIVTFTGHIPNWLVYSLIILLFYPSTYGVEGKVSGIVAAMPLIMLIVYGGYCVYGSDWNNILSNLTNMRFGNIIVLLILGVMGVVALVYLWLLSNYLMGFWFHYLAAIEWKYGSWKAFSFAIVSLGIILGGGYLLYANGIIF